MPADARGKEQGELEETRLRLRNEHERASMMPKTDDCGVGLVEMNTFLAPFDGGTSDSSQSLRRPKSFPGARPARQTKTVAKADTDFWVWDLVRAGACLGLWFKHLPRCGGLKPKGPDKRIEGCKHLGENNEKKQLKKKNWHYSRFCHCEYGWVLVKKAASQKAASLQSVTKQESEALNVTHDTRNWQLEHLSTVFADLQKNFQDIPPSIRVQIMTHIDHLQELLHAHQMSSNSAITVACPRASTEAEQAFTSLETASTVALARTSEAVVYISTLDVPGRICIDNTYGKQLVFSGSHAPAAATCLSEMQFQMQAWAAFRGSPEMTGESQHAWKRSLKAAFSCAGSGSNYISFDHFLNQIKELASHENTLELVQQLGIDMLNVRSSAEITWERILAQKSGFIACESLVIGGSADVKLQHLNIRGTRGGERALMIRDNAKVVLHSCDFTGVGNAIHITNHASVKLQDCCISACGSSGLVIADLSADGKCEVIDCFIYDNAHHGVAIGGKHINSSNCIIRNTLVSEN
eukprot:TRINITY_DN84737_c0_g1_i1.p1 TRINITY_DN84737_c0_g1~~TRINITY_DN84737_c0_g1_i1.p1  ORF type:complete len:524 (+),score=71.43 TRINITY_DN84737_c0_g1_i1:91-1662(+)